MSLVSSRSDSNVVINHIDKMAMEQDRQMDFLAKSLSCLFPYIVGQLLFLIKGIFTHNDIQTGWSWWVFYCTDITLQELNIVTMAGRLGYPLLIEVSPCTF